MVDIDRNFECEQLGVRPVSQARAAWDPVNPNFDGEPFAVGQTPDGQYVLLMPVPSHLGVMHRQVRLCGGDHAAELERLAADERLAYQDGGPGCRLVVWASTLPK